MGPFTVSIQRTAECGTILMQPKNRPLAGVSLHLIRFLCQADGLAVIVIFVEKSRKTPAKCPERDKEKVRAPVFGQNRLDFAPFGYYRAVSEFLPKFCKSLSRSDLANILLTPALLG